MVWKLTSDGLYSSSSAYQAFFLGRIKMFGAKELWATLAPPKVKLFFWLALHKRLWTAERRRRHGLQQNDSCALCLQESETADHLLVACVFTRELWHRVLVQTGYGHLAPGENTLLVEWWHAAWTEIPVTLRRGFDSLVLLTSWTVWKERSRRAFDGISCSLPQVFGKLCEEGNEWVGAGFRALAPLFGA